MGAVASLVLSLLTGQVPVLALEENCTPTAGFTNCVRFTYSGSNQTFTVPAGFVAGNFLHAEVWGAGGGGSTYMGAYTPNSGGGAGGYASTAISGVTAGDSFTVLVGQGGLSNTTSPAFGGGGLVGAVATGSGARGSGGGGMSGIFLDPQLDFPIQISGGGGGGSPGSNATGNPGGGGGTGNAPNPGGSEAGRPGTTTAGGAGAPVGNCSQLPTAGSRYQGGKGAAPGEPGGGGGGGYFGGGGGSCQTSGSIQNGGGGGGSGFVSTSRVIVLKSGNGGVGPLGGSGAVSSLGTTLHGSGGQYRSGVGVGGAGNTTANGGNGMVVFQWSTVPQPPSAANPDASSGKAATVQSIAAAQANDTLPVGFNWVVSSIRLCTQAEEQVSQASRSCTVGNNIATRATASNEGQYRLNTTNGSISFTPDAGFSGTAVPITYQISDNAGRVFWSTYTPKVIGPPGTAPDSGSDSFGAIQTLQVLTNDQFDPGAPANSSTLRICASASTMANCTLTTLQVANVGRFEVLSGAVKFTPCTANGSPFASPSCTQGYVGTSSIQYRIADSLGQTSTASVTVTTQPPAISASGQTKSVLPSSSVSFTALIGVPGLASGVGLTACLVSSGTSCVANNSFQISGQGTFNYDPNTKTVRFTSLSTLTPGASQSVVYKVTDAANQNVTASLTVVAPLPPTLAPDSPFGAAGATQRIAVLANDSPGDATSPLLPSSLALCPTTSSLEAQCNLTTLTIQGQGTYSVGPDGAITFVPVAGFDGPVDQIKYVVSDSLGQIAGSTVSTTVLPPPAPATQVDLFSTGYGSTSTFRPLLNDSVVLPTSGYTQTGSAEISASSLRLCGPSDTGSSCSQTAISTAAGTYVLDVASGQVTFTPALGFSGRDLYAPNYSVCVSISGTWSPATPPEVCSFGSLDVTVESAPPPTAATDSSNGPLNTQLSVAVTDNDSAAPGRSIDQDQSGFVVKGRTTQLTAP